MASPRIIPIDRAATFNVSDLFFSTTNRKGQVEACNDVFLRIAEYPAEEMLGAAHSIIRHPDMPKCVFDLLWSHLLAGKPIAAYVKNMARTGEYYWVYALVFPIDEGFLSIRLKPTSPLLETVEGVYGKLLEIERGYGTEWRDGMQAATEELLNVLSSIGFDSYDEFMVHALQEEITSRNAQFDFAEEAASSVHMRKLRSVFQELGSLALLKSEVKKQGEFLLSVSESINRIALNSSICAAKMEEEGRALGVLSEQASALSFDIADEVETLGKEQGSLTQALQTTAFRISFASLVAEMDIHFAEEARSSRLTDDEQRAQYGGTCDELAGMLQEVLSVSLGEAMQGVSSLQRSLRAFNLIIERFARILLRTRINHVTGRSIAASLEGGEQYSDLLSEMLEVAEGARTRLDSLQKLLGKVNRNVRAWRWESSATHA